MKRASPKPAGTGSAGAPCVLALNGGSSSIRFAVFAAHGEPVRMLWGKIERIGQSGSRLVVHGVGQAPRSKPIAGGNPRDAAKALLAWLGKQRFFASIRAVGPRVVHGMGRSEPQRVTARLMRELRAVALLDPDHLPVEIALMTAVSRLRPALPQVACFDTAFHRGMPLVARQLAIPRKYRAKGIERYGFHGLSYAYLMEELKRIDPSGAKGRVILAHLGSGASMAAVLRGRSIDTSMAFTPAAGLVMGTRPGDLDPGIAYYLAQKEGMTPARFHRMVNHESGLLGISGTSSDIRDLLSRQAGDPRASEAVSLFCYQTRKWVGSYAAALGGLDTLVFAGGIGENSPVIRRRICEGLGFLGIALDARRNGRNAPLISARSGGVKVRVIQTDEELMVARSVMRLIPIR